MIIPVIVITVLAIWGKHIRKILLKPYAEKSTLYKTYLEKEEQYNDSLKLRQILQQTNGSLSRIQQLSDEHFQR